MNVQCSSNLVFQYFHNDYVGCYQNLGLIYVNLITFPPCKLINMTITFKDF